MLNDYERSAVFCATKDTIDKVQCDELSNAHTLTRTCIEVPSCINLPLINPFFTNAHKHCARNLLKHVLPLPQ